MSFLDGADRNNVALTTTTGTITIILAAENIGRSAANAPTVVEQDNLELLSFDMGDEVYIKFPVPADYESGGIMIQPTWTNDGGVDDNNLYVKAQVDYQVAATGEAVNGNHANSPRVQEDRYLSASGWIEHRFDGITIPDGEIAIGECVFIKLSFIAPAADPLSCNPHLIGVCLSYTGYVNA